MKTDLTAISKEHMRINDTDWEEVYETFLPRIFHFFCYKVGNPQIAEDLTATTFEKAWSSRGSFRKDHGQVHAWLLGIARHVAGDHFRKPCREVPFDEALDVSIAASMDEDLQRRLDFQRVSRMLSHFPDRDRELIALKYGAELTNREISKITGLSESNVGTILYRVVSKLRKELEQEHG
jgi:RNA polymerase sigma-70 factor, ECF subfamily